MCVCVVVVVVGGGGQDTLDPNIPMGRWNFSPKLMSACVFQIKVEALSGKHCTHQFKLHKKRTHNNMPFSCNNILLTPILECLSKLT